jgi:hypothetical protein
MSVEKRIEVNGRTGLATLKAFGHFTLVGSKYLLDEGLGQPGPEGMVELDANTWYPVGAWLRALSRISAEYGDRVIFKIGQNMVGSNTVYNDVTDAIRSLDSAYHRNHRLDGRLMWDAARERALEGIGCYGYERIEGENAILSRCDNPYPCTFDHGVLTALSRKYDPTAEVTHEPGACRQKGQESCTYRITWKKKT